MISCILLLISFSLISAPPYNVIINYFFIFATHNLKKAKKCCINGLTWKYKRCNIQISQICNERGETMSFDKLKGKMTEGHLSQKSMAQNLGITVQALNAKLNGRSQFTLGEVVKITEMLSLNDPVDIFFNPSVPKMQQNKSDRKEAS
nr:MAG TPA: repressor protein CI [Caudoviricetes sp.]